MLKIFFRILLKHRYISILNISGLAVGMAAFLLILHYVRFEYSFDRFHADSDRIYRIIMTRESEGEMLSKSADTYPAMAKVIQDNYPGVEAIEKILYNSRGGILTKFNSGDQEVLRDDLKTLFASPDFFRIFSVDFIEDGSSWMSEPFKVMISEDIASSIYANQDPIGKLIQEDDGRDYEIVGVFEKWQKNSHLNPDIIKSFNSIGARHESDLHQVSWDWPRMKTYIKLEAGVDPRQFEGAIADVINQNKPKQAGIGLNETIGLQPIKDIRLKSDFQTSATFGTSKIKVDGFLMIGFVILLMSWINFINLTIAKGLDRIKESGVRKVLGASKSFIINQHFLEALGVNLLGFVLALSFYQLLLPTLHEFADIPESYRDGSGLYLILLGGVIVGGLVSGLYPAIVLSRINLLMALKKKVSTLGRGVNYLRNILSSVQFAVSLALLIIISAVYQQLNHLKSIDAGTRIEGIYVVEQPRVFDYEAFAARPDVIKEEWKRIPGVNQVASSYAVPGGNISKYGIREYGKPESANVNIQEHTVDYNFNRLYGLEFVAGRDFSKEIKTDENAAVLNLVAIQALGFDSPEEALGKRITSPENEYIRHIIGVVKDFYQQSAHSPKEPLVIALDQESRGYYSIAISSKDLKATVASIKSTFNQVFPGNIYKSFFLDDYYNQQFESDEQLSEMLSIFTLVAVILAIMGLISITFFSVVKRMKEVSIRKVLGAGWSHLLVLFGKQGNGVYLIASLIAIPISFYLINKWLEGFNSRISLNVFDFSLPLILLYVIALCAVIVVLKKAINSNPIDSIREE